MDEKAVTGAVETLAAQQEFERALADLYETCALVWPGDADFWLELAVAETRHSASMEQIAGVLAGRPGDFAVGRPLNPAATGVQTDHVVARAREFRAGGTAQRTALLIARDLERSILESRFHEIVVTADPEYLALVERIVTETAAHAAALDQRLAAGS